jgi:signal transduction histidine kinase
MGQAIDRVRGGMASRLLLAFAALILPLALFSAWSYQRALEERRAASVDDAARLGQTAAAIVHGVLRDLDSTTLAMSQALGVQQIPLAQPIVGPYLDAINQKSPVLRAIFLMDPDGIIIATPTGESLGTDLSSRPYMQALMSGQDFVLSEIVQGVQTGEPTITMARAVRAPDGTLRGYLAAAFYPSRLADVFPGSLPDDAILSVYDARGWAIYSTAASDIAWEQRDQSGSARVQAALAGQVFTARRVDSPLDDGDRLVAAVPVPAYGWAVSVSRTLDAVEQPLQLIYQRQVAALTLVTLIALALAAILSGALSSPLARLAAHARAVGRGEATAPAPASGPTEVKALAAALNAMAQEVQERFAERDAALAEAQAALAVRDQFLSVAAHELRTPLTAMKGQIQLARRLLIRGAPPDDAALLIERADAQTDRLTGLITDLLDVSRISAGRLTITPRPVALAPLVERTVEMERGAMPPRSISVVLPDPPVTVEADPARLEQVLINLLENARKYSSEEQPIEVRVTADDDHVTIAVRDQGIGIPPQDLDQIFERFHRAGNVDGSVSGLGLGLYITHEIVRAHGGDLRVESEPGVGSTFSVVLPRNGVQSAEGEPEVDVPPPARSAAPVM